MRFLTKAALVLLIAFTWSWGQIDSTKLSNSPKDTIKTPSTLPTNVLQKPATNWSKIKDLFM